MEYVRRIVNVGPMTYLSTLAQRGKPDVGPAHERKRWADNQNCIGPASAFQPFPNALVQRLTNVSWLAGTYIGVIVAKNVKSSTNCISSSESK